MHAFICRDAKRIGFVDDNDEAGLGVLGWFHANVHSSSMAHALEHEGYSVEPVDAVDCQTVEADLGGLAERLGLSADFTFVPFSASRNAKAAPGADRPWQSLNWKCTLKRFGRPFLTTDYGQGVAHCPAEKRKWPIAADKARAVAAEIETGREALPGMFGGTPRAGKPIAPPSIGAILSSLAMDSSVLDSGGFEAWASEYGYSTDSRSAESTYRACLENALALQGAIGGRALSELRALASYN